MIFLGLGSNLASNFGDRFETINSAINVMSTYFSGEIIKSSFYETPSYPNKENPKFINIMILIKPNRKIDLNYLVDKIFLIEKKFGRTRNLKNEPRTIDIDIIDYFGKILELKINDTRLIKTPHERLFLRNFVLIPLKEICPNWKHPKTGKHIDDLISKLSDLDKKSILKINHN